MLKGRLGLEVCGWSPAAREGLRLVRELGPDLVIVDLTLSQGHGMELLKDLQTLPAPPVALVMSGHEDEVYAERCLAAGAHGYVRKTCDSTVILEAVRRVLAGQVYVGPEVMQRMLGRRLAKAAWKPALGELSDREIQVLEGMGRGQGAKEIAASMGIDAGTIDNHRSRLKEKLGLTGMHALAIYAFQWVHLGIRPPVPVEDCGAVVGADVGTVPVRARPCASSRTPA